MMPVAAGLALEPGRGPLAVPSAEQRQDAGTRGAAEEVGRGWEAQTTRKPWCLLRDQLGPGQEAGWHRESEREQVWVTAGAWGTESGTEGAAVGRW